MLKRTLFLSSLIMFCASATLLAQGVLPGIDLRLGTADTPEQVSTSLQIIILLTILTLAPAILIMTTSFTRLIIVFAFIRQALGTQQTPPTQILVGLALFLTFFIMEPVWMDVYRNSFTPYMDNQISQSEALDRAAVPMKNFMQRFVRNQDLLLFINIADIPRPRTINDVPLYVLIPAFVISELKTAFQIGFLIYMPFLVIDLVVSSVLMAMGMMMLPPIMISLPLKLMLFVLVDGWNLIVGKLVESYFT